MNEFVFIVVSGLDPIFLVISVVFSFALRRTNYIAVAIVPCLVTLASYLITKTFGLISPPPNIRYLQLIGLAWSSALVSFLVVYLHRKNGV